MISLANSRQNSRGRRRSHGGRGPSLLARDEVLHISATRWHVALVTELRSCRLQLGVSQAELSDRLGVPLNSLRMWDSGLRPTPDEILEQLSIAVAQAIRDNQPLNLPDLATELNVHVRTLQAAARTGRLEVEYSTRSVFGRPLRLSTRAAGKRFLRTYYKRYGGQPVGSFELPRPVPADCQHRLRELRLRLHISLREMAELVGAANRAVVYQWESGKRVPSPIFWDRISKLSRWANKPSANINPRARSSVG